MKLHTTITMRIVCAIFHYSSFTDRCRSSVNLGDNCNQAIFAGKYMHEKINKMPKFYLIFRDDSLWGLWVVAGSKFIFLPFWLRRSFTPYNSFIVWLCEHMISSKNWQNTRILHDICPKSIFFYFWGMPPFPTPILAWFKLRENFAHVTSGIRAVAGIFWIEFRTLLDDVTLAIS